MDKTFYEGEIISYNYQYVGRVVKIHKGYELIDIILYHPKEAIVNKPCTVSSTLCIKFELND